MLVLIIMHLNKSYCITIRADHIQSCDFCRKSYAKSIPIGFDNLMFCLLSRTDMTKEIPQ